MTTAEILILAGPAALSAGLTAAGLKMRYGSLFDLALPMMAAAVLAVLLSFFSTFTVAWTVHGTLPIIFAALLSAVIAATIVMVMAARARAH